MRQGEHFLADGFTSGGHAANPTTPRFINTDNMDFQKNMEITNVELMYTAPEVGGKDFSGDAVFFVLARTEEGATPQAGFSVSNFAYGLRMNDPDIIAWGVCQPLFGTKVIMSPHRLVPNDMWVNAWSQTAANGIAPVANSIGYAINMKMIDQSGTAGLLQTTLSVAAQENS